MPASLVRGLYALGAAISLLLSYAAGAQQFTFRQYGQQDGLSNLSVVSLLQDRSGSIWIGTENGLFRHDGTRFERFGDQQGLEDTAVHTVAEDSSGRLWVGTSHDLYLKEGARFRPLRPDGHALNIAYGQRIAAPAPDRLLVIDQESLLELSVTADGSWHSRGYFSAEQLRSVPALAHVSSLFWDRDGRLWLACASAVCRVANGRVDIWDAASGAPADIWHSWLLDTRNRLWVRGLRHILVLNEGASRFETRDTPYSRLTADILNVPLTQDAEGRILTRSDMGLMRWQQDHWEQFSAANGITASSIAALLTSRDGTLWLGMSGHGLWRWLGYGRFESWTLSRDSTSNPVWTIVRGTDGAITLGTRLGCLRIDPLSRAAAACAYRNLPQGEIQLMTQAPDGSLWLGLTTGPLVRIAPDGPRRGVRARRRAVVVGHIREMRRLLVDSSGRLWICSDYGIYSVAPGSNRPERADLPSSVGEVTDVEQEEDGTLWFATETGLLHWSAGKWSVVQVPGASHQGTLELASAGHGWLWAAGTAHGLMRLHIQGERVDEASWLSESHVRDATIYFLQLDRRGWLWVGTDNGVVLYDGRAWHRYSQSDGLIWNDIDQNAVLADADGTMWIGTSGGLSHVLEPEQLIDTRPIDLHVARASVGEVPLETGGAVQLGWRRGLSLELHLRSLDFRDPAATVLRVRLRGLSDEWFDTRDFDIHIPGLAPERYLLEAVAVDADHGRQSLPVRLAFEVLPPWWKTGWFKLLMAGAACVLLAIAWRWSAHRHQVRRLALERELREREALLERATRDALTRLWNRHAILDILARELEAARRLGTGLAVVLIDIDHFKRINDSMGHLTGDEVLRTLSAQLAARIRANDALGRYGGEELLLVLPEANAQRPYGLIERLRQAVADTQFSCGGSPFRVTASFGVAWLASASESAQELLSRADEALYAAKAAGRDRVEYAMPYASVA